MANTEPEYYIHPAEPGGDPDGPHTAATLLKRMQRGEISGDTLIYHEGLRDWTPAMRALRVEAGRQSDRNTGWFFATLAGLVIVGIGATVAYFGSRDPELPPPEPEREPEEVENSREPLPNAFDLAEETGQLLPPEPPEGEPEPSELEGPPEPPVEVEMQEPGPGEAGPEEPETRAPDDLGLMPDDEVKRIFASYAAEMELRGLSPDITLHPHPVEEVVLPSVPGATTGEASTGPVPDAHDSLIPPGIPPEGVEKASKPPSEGAPPPDAPPKTGPPAPAATPPPEPTPGLTEPLLHRASIQLLAKKLGRPVEGETPPKVLEREGKHFLLLLMDNADGWLVCLRYEDGSRFTFVDEFYARKVKLPTRLGVIDNFKFINDWPGVEQ